MGTTAQKLSYLNETKTKIKDAINLMGGNITNDTFRTYPDKIKSKLVDYMNNGTEEIWNNWDKLTASGTDISINNTIEAPMKIELKGNTSQFSTTGKNKLGVPSSFTVSSNYLAFQDYIDIPAGTYILSVDKITTSGSYSSLISFRDENGQVYADNLSSTNKSKTITLPSAVTKVWIYSQDTYAHSTSISTTFDGLMIRLSTISDATYEPYTGGKASPNPDYPQEVKVVKGDNVLKVEGKNLIGQENINSLSSATGTYNGNTLTFTSTGTYKKVEWFIPVKAGEKYTFSCGGNDSLYLGIFEYSQVDTSATYRLRAIEWDSNITTSGKTSTFTIQNDCYLRVYLGNSTATTTTITNVMLERGQTATSYEPYTSNSYPISLGVENLFNGFPYKSVSTGDGYPVANTGYTTIESFDSNNISFKNNYAYGGIESNYIPVKANETYTLSLEATNLTNRLFITQYNSSKVRVSTLNNPSVFTFPLTFTATNDGYITIAVSSTTLMTNSCTLSNIQIEKGNITHPYCKYGETPIELCKINTYQDKIIGNDGKNLFNKNDVENDKRLDGSGQPISSSATGFSLTDYIKVEPNTKYTYSRNLTSSTYYVNVCEYTSNKTFIERLYKAGESTTTYTFTTPSNCEYLRINDATTNLNSIQLEKGETATEYQPYGTGEYYKKEMVGGIVLDGTENWYVEYQTYRYDGFNGKSFSAFDENNPLAYSNYFRWANGTSGNYVFGAMWYVLAGNKFVCQKDENPDATSLATFKTWLGTNKPKVKYVLATPTYTKITNNTLIKQLDAIKKSKNSQTNISQENEDLPFELDVTALQSLN